MPGPEDDIAVLADVSNPEPAETPARADRPLNGILCIVASAALQAGADGATKFLALSMPVNETAWFRYATTVLVVFCVLLSTGRLRSGLRSNRPGIQLTRGIVQVLSGLFFLFALRAAPIVDVTATIFSAPLMVTAFSIVLLGERVGLPRWSAAIVGLIGVLIVMRPGSSVFNAALLWAVAAALLYALVLIITRKIGSHDNSATTMAYSSMIGLCVLTIILPFDWVVPTWTQLGIAIAVGFVYAAAHWLVIIGYRSADASLLAPYSYFQLVFVAAVGIVVFQELPDIWTVAGIGIIIASGFYNAQQERSRRASLQRAAKAVL